MMKKRILIALLCGVILASATACNTKEKSIDQSVETTIESPTENPTENPTEKPIDSPDSPDSASVFGDYQDLLGTLVLLQQESYQRKVAWAIYMGIERYLNAVGES